MLLSEDELRKRCPRATNASYEEYILGPGEMLFVPRWWWHFIVAVDRDSARRWRATHLPGQTNSSVDLDCKDTEKAVPANSIDHSAKRCVSPISAKSHTNCAVKRPRVALVLPPPQNSPQETPPEAFSTISTEARSVAETPLQDNSNGNSGEGIDCVDYSFSVSFWWGKRILKS